MAGRQGSRGSAMITLALLATLQYAMAATYTVGDEEGWNLNVDYKAWAAKYNFTTGDTLLFQYSAELHSVFQVGEASYRACNLAAPLKTFLSGDDTVMLTQATTYYFICGVPGHCVSGMAVTIPVKGTSSPPAPTVAPLPSPPKEVPSPAPTVSPRPSPPKEVPSPTPAKAPPTASPSPSPIFSHPPSSAIPSPAPSEAIPSPSPSEKTPSPSPSPSETTPSSSPSPSEAIPPAAANPPSSPTPPSQSQAPSTPKNAASALQSGATVLSSAILSGFLLFLV